MISSDKIIRATGKRSPFRLVIVDLTHTANEIGKKHGAKAYSLKLLSETAIASLFLSSGLKFPGTVSVRLKFSGDISLIQADSTPQGLVRAMIPQSEIREMNQFEPALLPQQFEVVKLNEEGKRVSQSFSDALEGSVGQNLANYLLQSEQVRSAVGIEAVFNKENSSVLDYAVGFMIEAYPDLSEKDIAIIEQVVLTLPAFRDFYKDSKFDLDAFVDTLKGPYDIDIVKEITPEAYCPCSRDKILDSLATLPEADLEALSKETNPLEIVCDFCRNKYDVMPGDISMILNKKKRKG